MWRTSITLMDFNYFFTNYKQETAMKIWFACPTDRLLEKNQWFLHAQCLLVCTSIIISVICWYCCWVNWQYDKIVKPCFTILVIMGILQWHSRSNSNRKFVVIKNRNCNAVQSSQNKSMKIEYSLLNLMEFCKVIHFGNSTYSLLEFLMSKILFSV